MNQNTSTANRITKIMLFFLMLLIVFMAFGIMNTWYMSKIKAIFLLGLDVVLFLLSKYAFSKFKVEKEITYNKNTIFIAFTVCLGLSIHMVIIGVLGTGLFWILIGPHMAWYCIQLLRNK